MLKIKKQDIKKKILIITKDLNKELIFYNSTKNIIDKLATFKRKKCIKYINLTKEFLTDAAFLKFADFLLKNSKGVHLNIGKVDNLWFQAAADSLAHGQYKFDLTKQVEIIQFTADGVQKENLIILNIKEKILQQAMAILLEMIYEKDQINFSKSGSFKKATTCHAVLHEIKYKWFCLPYYIKIKLGQAFTKIHCHILVNILKKKISDKRFTDLISVMYNNFLLCPDGFFFKLKRNKLQNNNLSFILCNIFLIQFDEYIKQKVLILCSKNLNKKQDLNELHNDFASYIPYHLKYNKKIRNTKIKPFPLDLNFLKIADNLSLKYVRYLDNCLFGVNGSYNLIFKIKQYIVNFLGSNYHLQFTIDTIKIVNTYNNKVKFLGVMIFNQKLETLLVKKSILLKTAINKKEKKRIQQNLMIDDIKLNIRKNLVSILNQKNKLYKSKLKDLINIITPCVWFDQNKKPLAPLKNVNSLISNYLFFFKSLCRILIQYRWHFYLNTNNSNLGINSVLPHCYEFHFYFEKNFPIEIANNSLFSKLIIVSSSFSKIFINIASWGSIQHLFLQQFKQKYDRNFGISSQATRVYNLFPIIYADISKIYHDLFLLGILNSKKKPMCNFKLVSENNFFIVQYYNNIGSHLLNYFRCVDNFYKIQNIVNFFLRFSLISTLKHKHKSFK